MRRLVKGGATYSRTLMKVVELGAAPQSADQASEITIESRKPHFVEYYIISVAPKATVCKVFLLFSRYFVHPFVCYSLYLRG